MGRGLNVFVLTGAGVSAESGLGTFRGGRDGEDGGLWDRFDPMRLATPEAFARDPASVQAFYNARRRTLLAAAPNAAHHALARLGQGLGDALTLVTQNIDDLHERAGSVGVLHMHGELLRARCVQCGATPAWREDLGAGERCPVCGGPGTLRPDVVWFGEMPMHLDTIADALARAELFVAIGTSGSVYPAAGLVTEARLRGIRTCELSLAPSDNAGAFDERAYGPATEVVPAWVARVLGS